MNQPIKKSRKKVESKGFHGTGEGIDFCDQCPFLGQDMNDNWICNPNDYIFGKVKDRIPVPKWCGNQKQKK